MNIDFKKNLAWKALSGLITLTVILGLLIFVPTWSLTFWQGWIYLLIFTGSAAIITLYLWERDPKLLERRVKGGPSAEKEKTQRVIQLFARISFMAIYVLSALDHRFEWSNIRLFIVIVGDILVALGFFFVFLVFRENTFTAATIEVAVDQEVITTGPYALVRHPMYVSALIMLFGTPLALGSWWGLLTLIPMTLLIVLRSLDEERFLFENLKGYREYCQKVRFRLIPLVW